jgi:(1->4)-alpha-D-glucan 1-alpha-D-glucosylmutase
MPGVPDFYQGTEFWDLSLVDPDNRRPVDFAERATAVASLRRPDWPTLARNWTDGHLKLAWTAHLLKLRTELADVFTLGDYQPLEVTGPHAEHAVAFARRYGRSAAIVIIARHFAALSDGGRVWPRGEALDAAVSVPGYVVDGSDAAELALSTLFRGLPVVVLRAEFITAERPARKRASAQA